MTMTGDGGARVLVTGGAGFIGQHLVHRLVRDGKVPVTVVDNLHRGTLANLSACAQDILFRRLDIRDRSALDEAMRGCEVVFHLAAQSSVMGAMQDREYSHRTNVQGTWNVLEAARQANVKRVVFTSSREVYGEPEAIPVPETARLQPKNHYGETKAAGEMHCREFVQNGLEVAVLRLANVYGPRDSGRVIPLFVEQALRGLPLVLYDGTQILDFVWIDIVVDALVKAAFGEFLPHPANIGSGKGITVADLARRVLQITESRSSLETRERRNVEVSRFVADTAQAQALLGLPSPEDPLFALGEVVKDTADGIGSGSDHPHWAVVQAGSRPG
jgi:UDP-glucose 4-epimerase